MDIRTNSDLCHIQHKLIGFYNRDEKCLQRGTDWIIKCKITHFEDLDLLLCDTVSLRECFATFESVNEKIILNISSRNRMGAWTGYMWLGI